MAIDGVSANIAFTPQVRPSDTSSSQEQQETLQASQQAQSSQTSESETRESGVREVESTNEAQTTTVTAEGDVAEKVVAQDERLGTQIDLSV